MAEVCAFRLKFALDNPMPAVFKERLFVWLSRFCPMRYCIVRHVGFLLGGALTGGGANSSGAPSSTRQCAHERR